MDTQFLSQLRTKGSKSGKKYYFMAGLPRSGSTLLSSILNQNPRFYSGPSSPVLSTMFVIEDHLAGNELFNSFPKPFQAKQIISDIINQFYGDISQPVIVDKNRAWPSRISYIEGYIGQKAKIICPVRSIDEILTSFITMIRRNPYREGQQTKINFIDEQLVKLNIPINDDNRCEFLASPEGLVGQCLNSINEAFQNGHGDRLHFVEYVDLINEPEETMNKLYKFLGETPYNHNFSKIESATMEKDLQIYGLSDMHEVRPKLEIKSSNPKKILSKYILDRCVGTDIWRQHE